MVAVQEFLADQRGVTSARPISVRERLCLYCPTALSRARVLVDFGGSVLVIVAASSMVGVLI